MDYINFLHQFRFKPREQVQLHFDEARNEFDLEIVGSWIETILYEVPLLALISEAYFRFVDKDWSYEGQAEQAFEKTKALLEHGCGFAEFGTRRRRDFKTQDIVIRAMCDAFEKYKQEHTTLEGAFTGTSNVYLAMKYQLNAVGTVAHEFFMAISALENVQHANRETLDIWYKVYQGALGVALTDTFTTPIFLKDFQHDLASKYNGVRHDSGDPMVFAETIVQHYQSIGIDPSTKVIVFSDSLTVDRAIALKDHAKKLGIKSSFGIGTSFTNDFVKASNADVKSKPMNIVIKLKECMGKRVIKLSDDISKHSADNAAVSAFEQNPDWCSLNLGVIICIECSGIHRSLGTHISKVRSLTLDKFTHEATLLLCSLGNANSNSIWEAFKPENKPGKDTQKETKTKYIQAKYIHKRFMKRSRENPSQILFDAIQSGNIPKALEAIALGVNVNDPYPLEMLSDPVSLIPPPFLIRLPVLDIYGNPYPNKRIDISLSSTPKDPEYYVIRYPIHLALYKQDLVMVEFLFQYGSNTFQIDEATGCLLAHLIGYGHHVIEQNALDFLNLKNSLRGQPAIDKLNTISLSSNKMC
ncbi:hypothetical protein G6F16_005446 [Rhizopus arrhizus]|nr:hypothetical protein G6F16_005446 [Rhizopus arrhizus]